MLVVGCGKEWVRSISYDQIVWKKNYYKKDKEFIEQSKEDCSLTTTKIKKILNFNSYVLYDFDSIRIYVSKKDTNLNTLIQRSFIQGQYFFSPNTKISCQPWQWTNPIKSENKNWSGYSFYLSNLREIKTTKFPKKLKNKIDLYKVFRISFRFGGQHYVNPEVFTFELTNKFYKCNQDTVSLNTFLEKATIKSFYQSGYEI